MMRKLKKLEQDVLKEAGNMGAGRASTALSQMIKRPITVTTTTISIVSLNKLRSLTDAPGSRLVGILFDVLGDLNGSVVILAPRKATLFLADILENKKPGTTRSLGSVDKDALKEMGNILVGAYLTSLSSFSKLNILESTPTLVLNNVSSVLEKTLTHTGHPVDYVMVIETKLASSGGHMLEEIILILTHQEFGKLFKAMVKKIA